MVNLTTAFLSLFLLVLLVTAASPASIELSKLDHDSALLKPCQETAFTFQASNDAATEEVVQLTAVNIPAFLNYSLLSTLTIQAHSSAVVRLVVLYPCDASQAGIFPFSINAFQEGEKVAATSGSIETSSAAGLSLVLNQIDVSPTGGDYACACGSAHFDLEIRNAGTRTEEGVVLVSSLFNSSISDNSYSLSPGESETKRIVLPLPCSTQADTYPITVSVARQGADSNPTGPRVGAESKPLAFSRSGVSVGRCFSSYLSGEAALSACLDGSLAFPFTVVNEGEVEQEYAVVSTLGSFSPPNLVAEAFSTQLVTLSVPASVVDRTGRYPFDLSLHWNEDSFKVPAVLDMRYCPGVTQEAIDGELANASQPFPVTRGVRNVFNFTLTNFNRFPWHNAHLEMSEFGRISEAFELSPGETRSVPVTLVVPSNFSSRNTTLFLFTDEGNASTVVELESQPTPLSGFFTLVGLELNDFEAALIIVAILLLVALAYIAHVRGEEKQEQDQIVSAHLSNIAGKTK